MNNITRKSYRVMGGYFTFMCYPQSHMSESEVEELFDSAYKEVKRIEQKFTDFAPSAFNTINEQAGHAPCPVDQEIFDLILKSIAISKRSDGLFDISYASVGHPWREARRQGMQMSASERARLSQFIDYTKIELDAKNKTVFLPHPEMKIGLGGIGKGYAVDRAFELLKSRGLYNFFVNGSGDIRVHSHSEAPRRWRLGLRNPLSKNSEAHAGFIQLAQGAVATSGGYIQKIDNSDKRLDHHILSPSGARSMDEIISATIISDDCLSADTEATIVMNKTIPEALSYLNQNQIFGALISKQGQSYLSEKALKCFGQVA